MFTRLRMLAIGLFTTVLVFSCGPSGPEPPAEVTKVLKAFFEACLAGDMTPAIELIEPAWLESQANELDMNLQDYKTFFATGFNNNVLGNLGLISYEITKREKVSETAWNIEVHQVVKDGHTTEVFTIVAVDGKWYIAGRNFD